MRWKFVVPASILFLIIMAFNMFFLDSILRRTAISGGEMLFGARVEISSLKTRFKDLSISVSGIAVADKNDVMKNLFETDNIRFSLQPLPLLSKKFIIQEMTVDGVKWGTQRTVSGALPPKKQAKFEKKKQKEEKESMAAGLLKKIKEKGASEIAALPAAESIKTAENNLKNISLDKAITLADLQSIKEIDSLKSGLGQKYADYEKRLQAFKIDELITRASAAADEAGKIKIQTVQDLGPAKEKIDKLNQSRDELDKAFNEIKSIQAGLSADFGQEKELLKKLDDLKNQDIQSLSSKLQLPSFTMGNITQSIFGPVWINRVDRTMYYVHLVRKYMPPRKKDDKKIVKTRMKGADISFPREDNPPDFLIHKIVLSGTTGGRGKTGEPMDFKGVVTDITSDPMLLGRPTKAEITGNQGAKKLALTGIFDHTREVAVDSFNINYSGIDVKDIGLPSSEYLPSFDKGSGTVAANFVLKGDAIESGINLTINNLTVPASNENDEIKKTIASLWAGINSLIVDARLTGTAENLNMSVTSNLDKILAERMKNLYGEKLTEIQNRIKGEVDRLTEDKKKELLAEFNGKKDGLLKEFAGKQKELQDKMDAAKKQVNDKQNEIKQQGESEKKKAEDELRNKAADKLKELFK